MLTKSNTACFLCPLREVPWFSLILPDPCSACVMLIGFVSIVILEWLCWAPSCHAERSEASRAPRERDPSLRSELALNEVNGVTTGEATAARQHGHAER